MTLRRGGRPTTTISRPSHILLIFSSDRCLEILILPNYFLNVHCSNVARFSKNIFYCKGYYKNYIERTKISRWLGVQGRTRGAPMGEPLLISHLLAFPFLRSGTVMYLGRAVVLLPPLGVPKIKIKRKPRLESNTWQWKRLRICLNSLLIQGEKSFSLLKRILHYTRCTMTESRLNDLNELWWS